MGGRLVLKAERFTLPQAIIRLLVRPCTRNSKSFPPYLRALLVTFSFSPACVECCFQRLHKQLVSRLACIATWVVFFVCTLCAFDVRNPAAPEFVPAY